MAKDGQVCFQKGPFANPVKQQRYTTEPVEPLDGINTDVCGAKLRPTAVLAYSVDCDCWCHLLDTHCCCMSPNGTLNLNLPSASHPPPPSPTHPLICVIHDITVAVKKTARNLAVLTLAS